MMKQKIATLALVAAASGLAAVALADDDRYERRARHHDRDEHDDEHEGGAARFEAQAAAARRAIPDSPALTLYREECGACHLAYPPGFLPRRSWTRILGGLEDHFGQNAELDPETLQTLSAFLVKNAAEARTHPRSLKMLRGAERGTPVRISELPYVKRQHDEVDPAVFARPAVTSRANCTACHQSAERWVFDEDDVEVPR